MRPLPDSPRDSLALEQARERRPHRQLVLHWQHLDNRAVFPRLVRDAGTSQLKPLAGTVENQLGLLTCTKLPGACEGSDAYGRLVFVFRHALRPPDERRSIVRLSIRETAASSPIE